METACAACKSMTVKPTVGSTPTEPVCNDQLRAFVAGVGNTDTPDQTVVRTGIKPRQPTGVGAGT